MLLFCLQLLLMACASNGQNTSNFTLLETRLEAPSDIHLNISCLATGQTRHSAIALNLPDDSKFVIQTQQPRTVIESVLNCSFETESCFIPLTDAWERVSYRDSCILDPRWEDFVIRKTSGTQIIPHSRNNLAISVRRKGQVTITLGNSEDYICLILTPNELRIELWISNKFFKSSKISKSFYEYHWNTFDVKYECTDDSTHRVSVFHEARLLITKSFYPGTRCINSTGFSIRSKEKVAWKIHQLSVIHSRQPSLLKSIPFTIDGPLCISLYFYACRNCLIHLIFFEKETILETKVVQGNGIGWQYQIFAHNSTQITQIGIETTVRNEEVQGYWFIDDIAECSLEDGLDGFADPTVISAKVINKGNGALMNDVNCQALKSTLTIMSRNEKWKGYTYTESEKCELGTIGPDCRFSCSALTGNANCEKTTICMKDKCFCSPGYFGHYCAAPCSVSKLQHKQYYNKYGHGCATECHHCWNNSACSSVNGFCESGCQVDYAGDKCDTFQFPVLRVGPSILSATHQAITIQVSDWTFIGVNEPKFYNFQYREAAGEWFKVTRNFEYNYSQNVTIDSLKSMTSYNVRAVLLDVNGDSYDKNLVPWTTVMTDCEDIDESEITATFIPNRSPWFTDVQLSWPYSKSRCDVSLYTFVVNNAVNNPTLLLSGLIFHEIEWGIPMTVQLNRNGHAKVSKTISIPDGPPSSVEDLTVDESFATSVTVSWQVPKYGGSTVTHYRISYMHLKFTACTDTKAEVPENQTQTSETVTITLSYLIPYSEYNITVVPISAEYIGSSAEVTGYTLQTDEADETIEQLPSTILARNLYVFWKVKTDCRMRKGPLEFQVQIESVSPWEEYSAVYMTDQNNYSFRDLIPYTQYLVTVFVKRPKFPKINEANKLEFNIRTNAANSPGVSQLEAYSKTTNAIYLRWKPPYPTYGEIEMYQILFKCYFLETQQTRGYICPLWNEYICYDIIEGVTSSNKRYVISVSVLNRGTQYSGLREITTVTAEDTPSAPEFLNATWLRESQNLNITWSHPFYPNGFITDMEIALQKIHPVKHTPYFVRFSILKRAYKRNYTRLIPEIQPAATYNISVRAINALPGEQTFTTVVIPPNTPHFAIAPSYLNGSSTVTTINITIPAVQDCINCKLLIILTDEEAADDEPRISDIKNYTKVLTTENVSYNTSWLAAVIMPEVDKMANFMIGYNSSETKYNYPLPNSATNVSLILVNEYKEFMYSRRYNLGRRPTSFERRTLPFYFTSSFWQLLLFIPILIYILYRKTVFSRQRNHLREMIPRVGRTTAPTQNPDLIPLTQPPEPRRPEPTKQKSTRQPQTIENNIKEGDLSLRIKLVDFKQYVKDSLQSGALTKQHQQFPRELTQPCEYGARPENKLKNRYANLIAYDATRVILKKLPDDPFSDYINANYIDGYGYKKTYIATQGPKPKTLDDFWRMVWQEESKYIIMLTNTEESGKKKCEQYWPNINESKIYGKIKVYFESIEVYADYVCRHFLVSSSGTTRKVNQLHFTTWPDHGVPMYPKSLVPLLKRIVAIQPGPPIIVHCSAGVGRTGTIILCDICLRMAALTESVDVLGFQKLIRDQRSNLVDNIDQYKLVHLMLVECLLTNTTTMQCSTLEEDVTNLLNTEGAIIAQMNELEENMWMDNAMRGECSVDIKAANRPKNRFQEIVPGGHGSVRISRFPVTDEDADYINAVVVDGYRSKGQFIVTQQPLPNTLGDFWRLVVEKNIHVIASLNNVDATDETLVDIYPHPGCDFAPVPYLKVKHMKTEKFQNYDIVTVSVTSHAKSPHAPMDKMSVVILQIQNWPSTNTVVSYEEIDNLLRQWNFVEKNAGSSPILVTCYDGATASGLFMALSFVIGKIQLEQECDVSLAVRTIRHNRKCLVNSQEQFEFLYKAAVTYVDSFEMYSNFQQGSKELLN